MLRSLAVEHLECRTLLDAGGPNLVVGRVLSSYDAGSVIGNQVTITYTVYNEQADPETGAVLSATIAPGVTVASTTGSPTRTGQNLAWSLGTIPGFGRSSVSVVVTLPGVSTLQLDTGAQATATLNGQTVGDGAPAAVLRAGAIDPTWLASTIDANTADPYVQEKAAELDYDPQKIFDYLRDQVGYESYFGSLRGARGTLWSEAGNALDVASLGVALMRASGVPAQYARGTLDPAQARPLILSMFPEPLRVLGYVAPGIAVADPASDTQLLAEAADHFWFRFDAGTGFRDADPLIPGAVLGQTFATPSTAPFATVPDALRHKVALTVDAETYNSGAALFGGGLATTAVLSETFSTVELVGKSLTVGNLLGASGIGAIFSLITYTYTPYFRLHDLGEPTASDLIVTDSSFQETLTNFPLGTQIVTGLFLRIDTLDPTDSQGHPRTESFSKALYDRIGFAARQSGQIGPISTSQDADVPPISELDTVTLALSPSRIPSRALFSGAAVSASLQAQLDQLTSAIQSSDPAISDAAQAAYQDLARFSQVTSTSLLSHMFLDLNDQFLDRTMQRMLVRAYADSPRIVAIGTKATISADDPDETSQQVQFDLLRSAIRNLGYPGQSQDIVANAGVVQGVGASILEAEVLKLLGPTEGLETSSAFDTIRAALDAGATLQVFGPGKQNLVEELPFSAEAKARINAAITAGSTVLVPSQTVVVNGKPTIAWFEIEASTRRMIAVSEDGSHSSTVNLASVYAKIAFYISQAARFSMALAQRQTALLAIQVTRFFIEAEFAFARWGILTAGALARAQAAAEKVLLESVEWLENPTLRQLAEEEIRRVVPEVIASYSHSYGVDPPAGTFIDSPDPNPNFANLGTGATGSVAVGITADPYFTVPFQGAQLPTAFIVGIKNLSTQDRTFNLTPSQVPPGFTAITSVPSIRVPAGATAEVGLYLVPTSSLGTPGLDVSFDVVVTDASDSTVTTTVEQNLTLPEVHGVLLESKPSIVSASPGTSATTTLVVRSVGNVPETVNLSALAIPGLTVTGLGTVTLAVGETKSIPITLTPDTSLPLNTTLALNVRAEFGGPQSENLVIPVRVEVPGAAALTEGEDAAVRLGNPDLADRLRDLGTAVTDLTQQPTSGVAKSQVIANLDAIIRLLGADPLLAGLVDDLTAVRDALGSATDGASVQAALNDLGVVLGDLGSLLSDLARHRFELSFLGGSPIAQPQVPTSFQVVLRNAGSETTTYLVSLEGVAPGLTGQLSQDRVTLAPGETTLAILVTITPGANVDFDTLGFTVRVTAENAPNVTDTIGGSLTPRNEFVSVVSVTTDPPFVEPGSSATVTARVLNAVNRFQVARATFTVRDASNQDVFTSQPVDVYLGVVTSIVPVILGDVDTTGYTRGSYSIVVTLTDANGQPIPGGSGQGSLLVGSPVSGSLTADQDLLPPGASTVTNTLTVTSQATLVGPLGVVSQTDVSGAVGVVRNGNYVYVSNASAIQAFDVTNPAAPQLVRTFGAGATVLDVHGDKLYAMDRGTSGRFFLRIYSLSDPSNPQLLGSATYNNAEGIPYGLAWHMVVTDTHVFVSMWGFTFLLPNDIKYQLGEVVAIDVSNPTSPHFVSALRNTYGTNNDGIGRYLNVDNTGGDGPLWEIQQLDANTLLVAGSTVSLDDSQTGTGVVHVLDISDPAHMQIVRTLVIPGTVHAVGLAIDGDRAFVTGSTTGWEDHGSMDFTGNTVLAVLDITNHRDPVLLGTQTLNRSSRGPADQFTAALGNGLFVFSSRYNPTATEAPALYVVDASNPQNLTYTSTTIPAFTTHLDGLGNFVYTTSASGLLIYQIQAPDAVPATARVDIPRGTGVSVVPGSFSLNPTRIIAGAGFDTYEWDLNLTNGNPTQTITWRTSVTGLQPGETRSIALRPEIDFTALGASGSIPLPELHVAGQHILALDPPSRSVAAGDQTTFDLTVSNPTSTAVTYTLAIQGVPSRWTDLPASINVAAGGSVQRTITFQPEFLAALGDFGFVITATTPGGTEDSVSGTLTVEAPTFLPDGTAHGVALALDPTQAAAGPGTPARYALEIVNTGSITEVYNLSVTGLPAGYTAGFSEDVVVLWPGVGNRRQVTLTITPPAGAAPAVVPFNVVAASVNVAGQVGGSLTVGAIGVVVALSPTTGVPGDTIVMTVTNRGTLTETFNLSLGALAGLGATLDTNQVRLAPGESTTVNIRTAAVPQMLPGALRLVALAVSQTEQAIQGAAQASLSVGTTSGLDAALTPATRQLTGPGATSFFLSVTNTGNVADIFKAEIVGVTGPVTASLVGLDGSPTGSIPRFALTGLGSGSIPVNAVLTSPGQGTVTIRLTSTTNPALTRTLTARVSTESLVATTLLVGASPSPTSVGQAVTLAAVVVPSFDPGTAPTGSVVFLVDGKPWSTSNTLANIGGQWVATATVTGLAVGSHTFQATYAGDTKFASSVSALGGLNVTAVATEGPRVVQVKRFGYHATPTTLVVHFDRALDPARAQDVRNYRIVGPSGVVPVALAVYDASTLTVTLHPGQRLNLHLAYRLTIVGTGVGGVASASGALLDGRGDGQAGSDYATTVSSANLVLGAPTLVSRPILFSRPPARSARPMVRTSAPATPKARVVARRPVVQAKATAVPPGTTSAGLTPSPSQWSGLIPRRPR